MRLAASSVKYYTGTKSVISTVTVQKHLMQNQGGGTTVIPLHAKVLFHAKLAITLLELIH